MKDRASDARPVTPSQSKNAVTGTNRTGIDDGSHLLIRLACYAASES